MLHNFIKIKQEYYKEQQESKFEICDEYSDQINDYLNGFQFYDSCFQQVEQMTSSGCKRCNQTEDYLNEFSICISCCKWMEKMVPNGFKPNFKLDGCKRCGQKKDYLNEFNECDLCEKCKRCGDLRKDYLNEFQICNTCYRQIEQIVPSGFKPNIEFTCCKGIYHYNIPDYLNSYNECESCEKCKRCNNQRKDYPNESLICNTCYNQIEQMTPSGFKPNFKLEKCKGECHKTAFYLNEYNECESCEKCNRCKNQRKDYLNGFQYCNLCCQQIKQMTPSGFKPVFKFETCDGCYQTKDYLNEFNECESCEKCKRCRNKKKDYLNGFQQDYCNLCYQQIEQNKCNECNGYLNEFNECESCEKCKKCKYQRKDHLNGFQYCNSCCQKIEQMVPSGFKPNFKLEKCRKCYNELDYLNEYNECESCEKCRRCINQRKDYLNGFQYCNSCYQQILEQMIQANFIFKECKECNQKTYYINEFKECESCEKCKKCKYQRKDYFNGSQYCNSCHEQVEQMIQSGFKLNFKFEKCRKCYNEVDYLNEFLICNLCCKWMEKITPSRLKPNYRFGNCKRCARKKDYLNEFNECENCEKCEKCYCKRKDYLNEFQVCNLCYKQMKQTIPNGFKPNFKFEKCKRCDQKNDYLNEFLVCCSCCKWMEEITPSGFEPNFKFEECEKCQQKRDCLNEYLVCSSCCKQMKQKMRPSSIKPNFKFEKCKRCDQNNNYLINEFLVCDSCSISGNTAIDNLVHGKNIKFISDNEFKDTIYITNGGFSKIYKAIWNGMKVALKELYDSKNINSKALNELRTYYNCITKKTNYNVNKYYGVTQNSTTKNFMIIMDYYESGDLSHYLSSNFFNISWYDKLIILGDIIGGLGELHDANIVHRDYHSGNILINKLGSIKAVVGDLGISKSALDDDDNEIYGIIPYVAPEIFRGQKYTKASDIYSFGMVMWELMTGRRPFWDQYHDTDLIIKICDDFRPPIATNAPEGYIELMKKCWHSDPNERPTAVNLKNEIKSMECNEKWLNNKPTEIIKSSADIGPITTNNPYAIYKSRPLSEMIESAESTGNLSKGSISEFGSLYNNNYKRKFYENLIEDNSDIERISKRTKQNENDDYVTTELELDLYYRI